MTEMAHATAIACTEGSDRGALSFPQVIGLLDAAGIERYHADLLRAEKTYYRPDGWSTVVAAAPLAQAPASRFDAAGVAAAIGAVQRRAIDYGGFCARIAAAGCVGYHVTLVGCRAVYYGRDGACHVELFPAAA
ncbi:DUF1398 family protein [Tistrella sp. BH-R2-4]|uniref:DUF1398 family protein n=1 Tax=Tistrella arctica TaxID=3133430 RepID=A0ABU9YNJ8_9PROT